MIIHIVIGTTIACFAGTLAICILRKRLNPVLLSAVILGVVVVSPFAVLLLDSPLNVEALIFWVIPVISLLVLIPVSRLLIRQDNWAPEKKQSAQKIGLVFLWIAFAALAVGAISLLVGGKDSEIGLLVMFLTLPLLVLFGVLGSLVFAVTVNFKRNMN